MRTRFPTARLVIVAVATITLPVLAGEDCNDNGVPDDVDVNGLDLVETGYDGTGAPTPLDWMDNADDGGTSVVPLPFPVVLGGQTLVAFVQDANGYVELLREGDEPYHYGPGAAWDLVNWQAGTGIEHTYLMAAYDDLSSDAFGVYGYESGDDRVIFSWTTETACDEGAGLPSAFQIVLEADGTIGWNFAGAAYGCWDHDLYTGLHVGYDVNVLHEIASGWIPGMASWAFHESTGVVAVPFEIVGGPPLAWQGTDDEGASGVTALPWPVLIGDEVFTSFVQDANGFVELLRAGDLPVGSGAGSVGGLTGTTDGDGDTHTFLMAAYDDLASNEFGYYGHAVEADRVVFAWNTETSCDAEGDDVAQLNAFRIALHQDGSVDWTFDVAAYICWDADLFTGVHLGYASETLVTVASGEIPARCSWLWNEHGVVDPTSEDGNGNDVPDECDVEIGDLDGDGTVNGSDLGLLLASWGACRGCPADIDGDGAVDALDLGLLLAAWFG